MTGDTTERFARTLAPVGTSTRHRVGLVGLAGLAALPVVVRDITVLKVTGALYFAVFVMSWDAVSGYTGQISFGHALFFGVGGYTSGLLNVHLGLDPLVTIPAGALAATVAGLVVGVPALRVRGPYFSLITLIAPVILLRVFVYFSGVTGGEVGLLGVEKLTFDVLSNYYLAFGLFVGALAAFLAVTRSDAGSVFTAIREDEDAVSAAGINPAKFKIFAFVLSGAVGGLAGAVFAHSNVGSVAPSELLALTVSIEVIIAAILGGMGTIVGAAVGGLAFYLLADALRNLDKVVVPIPLLPEFTPVPALVGIELVVPGLGVPLKELDLLLFGLVTLGFIFFVPEGILPRALSWGRRVQGRRRGEEVAADGGRTPLAATLARYRDALARRRGGDGK